MPKDIDAVSKVVIVWKNKCLLLCRVDGKGWELPGGHLNLGENFVNGAIREVYEETKIKINKLKLVYKEKDYRLFACRAKLLKVTLSNEHTDYKWANRAELLHTKITTATKSNVKHIIKLL